MNVFAKIPTQYLCSVITLKVFNIRKCSGKKDTFGNNKSCDQITIDLFTDTFEVSHKKYVSKLDRDFSHTHTYF